MGRVFLTTDGRTRHADVGVAAAVVVPAADGDRAQPEIGDLSTATTAASDTASATTTAAVTATSRPTPRLE